MSKKAICHNYFRIKIFVKKSFFLNVSVTSEIPEYPSRISQPMIISDDSACVICEFVLQSIAKEIGNNKTRDWIEKVVRNVCNHLQKTVVKHCFEFVDDYVNAIINMLSEVVSRPKESCTLLDLCKMKIGKMLGTVIKLIITYYNYI